MIVAADFVVGVMVVVDGGDGVTSPDAENRGRGRCLNCYFVIDVCVCVCVLC